VTKRIQYSDHLDVLLALIAYFALAKWRSRSPNGLARDLGLAEERIQAALTGFPGLFRVGREPQPTAVGDQSTYTLHARYARRRHQLQEPGPGAVTENQDADERSRSLSDPVPQQDGAGEELDADMLRALLDFVSQEARAEREGRQHRISQFWIGVGVLIAAVTGIVGLVA
jgi:hypothetical protein